MGSRLLLPDRDSVARKGCNILLLLVEDNSLGCWLVGEGRLFQHRTACWEEELGELAARLPFECAAVAVHRRLVLRDLAFLVFWDRGLADLRPQQLADKEDTFVLFLHQ